MDRVQIFNFFEAVFWLLLAVATAWTGHRTAGFTPGRQTALTLFLAAFGLSDLWEIYSGAWWRPLPLLVLKATCLTGLICTAALIYASRWRNRPKSSHHISSRDAAPTSGQ